MSKIPSCGPWKPYADTALAKVIAERISIVSGMGKTQRQIAREIGYDSPNMISMFKRGETKVPLVKIPSLARTLGVNAARLFELAVQQHWPGAHEAITKIFKLVLTENEAAIVVLIRETTDGADPELTTELTSKIRAAFRTD
jgi:transcriptional regulator with XRE-family HTH domain